MCRPLVANAGNLTEVKTCLTYKSDTCTSKTGCRWSDMKDAASQAFIKEMESGSSKAPTVTTNTSKPSILCMPNDMMAPKADYGSV